MSSGITSLDTEESVAAERTALHRALDFSFDLTIAVQKSKEFKPTEDEPLSILAEVLGLPMLDAAPFHEVCDKYELPVFMRDGLWKRFQGAVQHNGHFLSTCSIADFTHDCYHALDKETWAEVQAKQAEDEKRRGATEH